MQPQPANPSSGELAPVAASREDATGYRRLLAILSSRAQRLGSRDPEAAAQEAFKRSWENAASQPALAYYFSETSAAASSTPAWSLDQLLAWLHTVLRYVVSEERGRVAYRMEVSFDRHSDAWGNGNVSDPSDPGANQLHQLLQRELESILSECFPKLDSEYQAVLRLRGAGMKYDEIAARLGQKENTIATWLSRAIRDLAGCVKRRTHRIAKR